MQCNGIWLCKQNINNLMIFSSLFSIIKFHFSFCITDSRRRIFVKRWRQWIFFCDIILLLLLLLEIVKTLEVCLSVIIVIMALCINHIRIDWQTWTSSATTTQISRRLIAIVAALTMKRKCESKNVIFFGIIEGRLNKLL